MSAAEAGSANNLSTVLQIYEIFVRFSDPKASTESYNSFNMRHEVVEIDEGKLGLKMGIFTQMTASVAIKRSKFSYKDVSSK
jgi:hypothetical protein